MSDLISREQAIDVLIPIVKSASLRNRNVYSVAKKCMSAIEELPSAERKGKWIRTVLGSTSGYGTTVMYQCSECEKMAISKYHYCPNCGSYMRGDEDERLDNEI